MTGNGNHHARTQRDSLHVIASLNPGDVTETQNQWTATADQTRTLWEEVTRRLGDLLQEPGWTGDSADTFRERISKDLLAGLARAEQAARNVAEELNPVAEATRTAYAVAAANGVPWDRDAAWRVEQKKVSLLDYVVNTVADVATGEVGINEAATVARFNKAQANADYEVKTASGAVRATVSASTWSGVEAQHKPQTEVTIGVVAPATNNFDVWMEALNLNGGAKQQVTTAANSAESSLATFFAGSDSKAVNTTTYEAPKESVFDGNKDFVNSGTYGSRPANTGTYTGDSDTGVRSGVANSFWMSGSTAHLVTPPTGTSSDQAAWVYPGSTWFDGTRASGVDPALLHGAPTGSGPATPLAAVGGAGGAAGLAGAAGMGLMGGRGAMPWGSLAAGLPAPGAGGIGAPGATIPGVGGSAAAGGPPTFQVGQGGRPVVAAGVPGTVTSNTPVSTLSQAQAQSAGGSGSAAGGQGGTGGGAGAAPMAGRKGDKKDNKGAAGESGWLEEDDDVWGVKPDHVDDWPR